MKAYMRVGGGTLPRGRLSLPPTDYVHRDEIGEIVSSILLEGIHKLQMTRLFSLHKNESIHEVWGGGDTLPRGKLPPPPRIDYVHRDEIGEIVSSILLMGIEDRNFKRSGSSQSLLSLHKNESIHEG